jgi:MscS family membrane protein
MKLTLLDYQLLLAYLGVAIVLHFLVVKICVIIAAQALRTKTKIDDYIILALKTPMQLTIWLIYIYSSLLLISKYYPIVNNVYLYLEIGFIVIFLIFILKIIKQLELYVTHEKPEVDSNTITLIAKISKVVSIFLLLLVILQFAGINISSILAFGGVGGLVIGMAAKDMLANIFGGLMVSLDKPFAVGDWIRVGKVEGTVEKIGWRTTIVRTFSKNPIYVPNSMFSTDFIETPSRMTNRRIRETIGLRYKDISKIKDIINNLETMLKNHSAIDTKALTMVYFQTFNNSSLDLIIYTFTKTKNWQEYQQIKSEILLKIYEIIADNNADIAFPTQTIKLEQE